MRVRHFSWSEGDTGAVASELARQARAWALARAEPIDLSEIEAAVRERGDDALAELTARYDATGLRKADDDRGDGGESPAWVTPEGERWQLEVPPELQAEALAGLDRELRMALELAVANVRAVAEAQVSPDPIAVDLPQGQRVTVREVAVGAAGIYAPGGGASYPSSVIMGAVPARAAGVGRLVVCTPPGTDGRLPEAVLAAAALCEVDELYAVGGAQAIFALARGTETIAPVDVIAGPGSARVQAAKQAVFGEVGIDSIAGPSELMVVATGDSNVDWLALDICAQAEHGSEGLLMVAAEDEAVLAAVEAAVKRLAAERPGVTEAPLALVHVPDAEAARILAQAVAPEHLQIDSTEQRWMLERLTTPGCVFLGRHGATAFGDYIAGSNHVLPTGGAGRFCGPLGPSVFRRRVSNVEIGRAAAAALAPHVDRLAREEGLPVHGESALARAGVE